MKASEIKDAIKRLHAKAARERSTRALYITASPGVGKTQIAGQAAAELLGGFKVIHAPLLQPEDYGMPVVHGKDKELLKFIVSSDKFPLVGSDCEEEGVFLIDELPQADAASQKILANLIQAREIHGHKLKEGWTIVATGNRVEDRAGANRILSHLNDRVTEISLDVSVDDWAEWAVENGVSPEVVAFIRFRPELLSNFDPKNAKNATPRSWVEGVAARLGVISKDSEFEMFKGDVGEGPAAEFIAFLKIFRSLPDPDTIIKSPMKAVVPKEAATRYAICGALLYRLDVKNFGNILKYVRRLEPEFQVLFLKDAITKCPKIAETAEYVDWAANDGHAAII